MEENNIFEPQKPENDNFTSQENLGNNNNDSAQNLFWDDLPTVDDEKDEAEKAFENSETDTVNEQENLYEEQKHNMPQTQFAPGRQQYCAPQQPVQSNASMYSSPYQTAPAIQTNRYGEYPVKKPMVNNTEKVNETKPVDENVNPYQQSTPVNVPPQQPIPPQYVAPQPQPQPVYTYQQPVANHVTQNPAPQQQMQYTQSAPRQSVQQVPPAGVPTQPQQMPPVQTPPKPPVMQQPQPTRVPVQPQMQQQQPIAPMPPQQMGNGVYNNPVQNTVPPQQPTHNQPHNVVGANPYYTQPVQNSFATPMMQPQMQTLPPQPKKEKTKPSVWVFILIISIVLAFFVGIFVTAAVYSSNKNTDSDAPAFHSEFENSDDENDEKNEDESKSEDKEQDKDKTNDAQTAPVSKDFSLKLEKLPSDAKTGDYTPQTAFDKISPSVVGILLYEDKITDNAEDAISQGSGIIISNDGYIVTNSHVLLNTKQYPIQVVTSENKKYTGKVVGYDARTDLGVIKIEGSNFTPATFGDSSLIKVGQDIVVVGNPGGLSFQNSLTKGIVSAVNREIPSNTMVKYIQTDAAINPGNSGGPVCNIYGQVIGISTSKISSTEYEGMSFAIPSDKVKEIVDDLVSVGYVEGRLKIGIMGYEVDANMSANYNVPLGIVITEILEDSPMDNGDIEIYDIITELDGEDIDSFQDIYSILEKHKEGDKIKVRLYRESEYAGKGDYIDTEITLTADNGDTQK